MVVVNGCVYWLMVLVTCYGYLLRLVVLVNGSGYLLRLMATFKCLKWLWLMAVVNGHGCG